MNGSEKSPKSVGQPAASATGAGADSALAENAVATQRFDEILLRLRGVVDKLETGNLPLEDSLKFFEEGIDLCRKGASILDSAERKVEVLLNGSGEAPRTAPFETPSNDGD
jgi:exodeoxyribonuclease VII small subunit